MRTVRQRPSTCSTAREEEDDQRSGVGRVVVPGAARAAPEEDNDQAPEVGRVAPPGAARAAPEEVVGLVR